MSMLPSVLCTLACVTSLHANPDAVTSTLNIVLDQENSTLTNKSLHFEEMIKNSLRKNNDDYPLEQQPASEPSPAEGAARRFNKVRMPYSLNPLFPGIPVPSINSLPPPAEVNVEEETTFFRGVTEMQKTIRDARKLAVRGKEKHASHKDREKTNHQVETTTAMQTDQWQRPIDKNKRLFLYTSTTKIAPSSAPSTVMATMRPHGHSKRMRMVPPKRVAGEGPLFNAITRGQVARIPLNAHRPFRTPPPFNRRPPNADQLDMAPARGAYIHDLRLKGRFCHRHVLWPEGPKYDSKGNIIMPAFESKKYNNGKSFADTTKPLFVLPRCCNCCKKSVLGCQ